MASIQDSWIQEVAESLKLPALSPAMCKTILPVIEMHIKQISQQAHKFQRRGKSASLSVTDINLALAMNKIEPVYGLSASDNSLTGKPQSASSGVVVLVDMLKNPLPPVPLQPELTLHWLAVNGNQPLIAENPSVISAEVEEQPHSLPKEMQHLYARMTGIILSVSDGTSSAALKTVLQVLENDAGIQELTPYLCRFFYQQIKSNTKRLPLLYAIIRSIKAMLRNTSISLEFHLQQLLPVVFTCIVSPKLSTSSTEDHWSLRQAAAEIIAMVCAKFSEQFQDLQPRVYKTYIDALAADKSLVTVYGGIVGLTALGQSVVKSILVKEHLHSIHNRLIVFPAMAPNKGRVAGVAIKSESGEANKRVKVEPGVGEEANQPTKQSAKEVAANKEHSLNVEMCKAALMKSLGMYMVTSMRMPALSLTAKNQVAAAKQLKGKASR